MLGSFGEVKWLGNIYIVLFCNAVFGVCASLALFNKFTARVRIAIVNRSVPDNGRLPCPVTTTKRCFIDRFEVAIKALVPIDALRALLEHYRGVWRDGVAMSRKYVHNGMLAFHAFNDLNVFFHQIAGSFSTYPRSSSATTANPRLRRPWRCRRARLHPPVSSQNKLRYEGDQRV